MDQTSGPGSQSIYVSELAFDDRRIGAAAVYCSDGRFGEQMDEFLQRGLGLPRYDRVAVPGGAACLAGHMAAYHAKEAMERQLHLLINVHGLRRIVLIAHQECAFYRDIWLGGKTLEEQQAIDLEKAAERIRLSDPQMEIEKYFARKAQGKVEFERWQEKR
jgi:hypothetical protein